MFSSLNVDLLAVGIAAAGLGIIGFTIFMQNMKSATFRAFLYFSIASIVWSIINFTQYHIVNINLSFWALRLVMFIAVLHSFTLFRLLYIFPSDKIKFPAWYTRGVIPVVFAVAVSTLTLLIFERVGLVENGMIVSVVNGPALPFFGAVILFLVLGGIGMFTRKTLRATGASKQHHLYVLFGVICSMALIIIFNFILPAFFSHPEFIPYAGFFLWVFAIAVAIAINAGLFNIKVAATALLIFLLSVAVFFEILYTNDTALIYQKILELMLIVVVGILLVHSVFKEVEEREEVHKLATQLADTNFELEKSNTQLKILDQRKSEFVSLVSHQLRAPITAISGYTSMILEGSYGKVPEKVREPIERVFTSSQRLVAMVAEFLDISKIEQGEMTYTFAAVDIQAMLSDLVGEFVSSAQKKGLRLDVEFSDKESFIVTADEGKVRQIISNLIDNSIKYTPRGSVKVRVSKDNSRYVVVIRISDTGIGLSAEDKERVFGKFARGKEGQKENIGGSGLSLYVAKTMVEAQRGKIRVESDGPGKGSVFIIELPAEKEA